MAIAAIVIGFICFIAAPFSCVGHAVEETTTPSTMPAANVSTIGQPIRVGDIEWTLQTPQKTQTIKSDNPYIPSAQAQGVFIVIPATVEQVGGNAGTLDPSQINVIDSTGREFEPSTDFNVSVAIGSDKMLLPFKQLNPNVPVSVIAVFDVATDATGLKAQINSGGLTQRDRVDVPLGL